jgi:hypothetical protein
MLKSNKFRDVAITVVMQLRFPDAVKGNEEDVAKAIEVVEQQLRRHFLEGCNTEGCDNEARYTSELCSICDMMHNEGRGRRKIDL